MEWDDLTSWNDGVKVFCPKRPDPRTRIQAYPPKPIESSLEPAKNIFQLFPLCGKKHFSCHRLPFPFSPFGHYSTTNSVKTAVAAPVGSLQECQCCFERLLAPPVDLEDLAVEEKQNAARRYKTSMLGPSDGMGCQGRLPGKCLWDFWSQKPCDHFRLGLGFITAQACASNGSPVLSGYFPVGSPYHPKGSFRPARLFYSAGIGPMVFTVWSTAPGR